MIKVTSENTSDEADCEFFFSRRGKMFDLRGYGDLAARKQMYDKLDREDAERERIEEEELELYLDLQESCDAARERQRLANRSVEERIRDFDREHPFLSGLIAGFGIGAISDWLTDK